MTSDPGFNTQDTYPCPACRLGQIQTLPLMEAMACNACQHIFTIDLKQKRLFIIDRAPTLTWYWNGKHWAGTPVKGIQLGWGYWLSALALALCPPALIGGSAYFLLPTASASPPWVAIGWTGLTFLAHLALIGRSVTGFYRFPVGIYFSVFRRRLFSRLFLASWK